MTVLHAPRRTAVLLALLGMLALLAAPGALAHESTPTGVTRLELDLGARQLSLTITAPPEGQGRMPVVVLPRGEAPPGEVQLAAVRPGAAPTDAVAVPVAPVGQPHEVVLATDGPGAWEITVADGTTVARVPIVLAAPAPTPGWVWAVRVGALVGVVALVVALTPSVRQRPRAAVTLGVVALVGVTVAATAIATAPATPTTPTPAAAQAPVPAPPAGGHAGHGGGTTAATPTTVPGMTTTSGSVVATARTATPAVAGAPTDLELDLTDSSTGAVVDDLAVHDDALIHLAVIGPGGTLDHLHPVRTGPGHYVVRLTPGAAGRYGVFAEMERAGDGGHQVARTAIDVTGPATPAAPAPGPGVREVAGMQVDVAVPDAVAGRPTTITATFGSGGRQVTDLQGWLGMAGHLMLLGPGLDGTPDPVDPASAFGHVHDMGPAGPSGTYGPRITFEHTFPSPGRHQLWVQVQRDWQIVTVPVTVDVAPGSAPTP
ncbi:hypothetical protein [Actinomycetospora aeridis]|uniref:Secreted protein n=1 Tax=Actinomycetospora aeridis TaxID=3129231 RepID=A0ABU8MXV4_9PSEU